MKLTSQIVPDQVCLIVFEDFLIEVGAWSEVSVQLLEDYISVFLSENETFHFYSERNTGDLQSLSQTRWRKMHPINFMLLSWFAIPNSLISLFFTVKRNIVVHWQGDGILSFPRSLRERNQSLRDHRWALFSAHHNSYEKKKSCSLPQGIFVDFLVASSIFPTGSDWQPQHPMANCVHSNKNRFHFQHRWNDALRHQLHPDRWFILRQI